MSPPLEDIVLFEQIRAWLEPSAVAASAYLGGGPLHERIPSRRESFELFIGAADEDAVRDRMQRVPYGDLILDAGERHGVDPLLVAAIVQAESSFDTEAVSPRGALGLMQMMPTTAEQLGVADAYDPSQNLDAGVSYLAYLLRRFDNDLVLALAGYNAGPGRVDRFGGFPPFARHAGSRTACSASTSRTIARPGPPSIRTDSTSRCWRAVSWSWRLTKTRFPPPARRSRRPAAPA